MFVLVDCINLEVAYFMRNNLVPNVINFILDMTHDFMKYKLQ